MTTQEPDANYKPTDLPDDEDEENRPRTRVPPNRENVYGIIPGIQNLTCYSDVSALGDVELAARSEMVQTE